MTLRLPEELHEALKRAALVGGRSLHGEVLWRLRGGLDEGASKVGDGVPPMSAVPAAPGLGSEAPSSSPPGDIFAKFAPQGPSSFRPDPKPPKKR